MRLGGDALCTTGWWGRAPWGFRRSITGSHGLVGSQSSELVLSWDTASKESAAYLEGLKFAPKSCMERCFLSLSLSLSSKVSRVTYNFGVTAIDEVVTSAKRNWVCG